MISTKVLRTVSELESLEREWKELLLRSSCDNPFLTWEWVSSWLKVYFRNGKLLVVVVYDDTTLAGLAPLWVHDVLYAKVLSVRSLEFLGSGITCSDHLDLIVQKKNADQVVRAIWDHFFGVLAGEWDIFNYNHVRANSPVLDRLVEFANSDHRCPRWQIQGYAVCPYVRLPNTWESYVASLSANSRRALKTSHSLLSEAGRLELRICRTSDELPGELERFIALHQAGWRDRGKPGSFSSEGFEAFHRDVAMNLLGTGMLFLCSLWLDEKHIGSFYGYRKGGTLFYYLMGVDRDAVKKASTGRVLIGMCIEEAIRMGCSEFDMLRGRESYKYDWTESDARDISVTFYKTGMRSIAYMCSEQLYQLGKLVAKTILGSKSESISRWRRNQAG